MAKVGAQRAAELTGKSKSTIQRAMNSGKLSFELDANGRRIIDVSELERVFGLQENPATQNNTQAELDKVSSMLEVERMKMRIKMLEDQLEARDEQIEDLKAQRDKWQTQASQVLITSQHSQKQADELRAEIREREERARMRKQQMLDQRMKNMQAQNQNAQGENDEQGFGFYKLLKRVRG